HRCYRLVEFTQVVRRDGEDIAFVDDIGGAVELELTGQAAPDGPLVDRPVVAIHRPDMSAPEECSIKLVRRFRPVCRVGKAMEIVLDAQYREPEAFSCLEVVPKAGHTGPVHDLGWG